MAVNCESCTFLYEEEPGTECCLEGLFDRLYDDDISRDEDYERFITCERICSEYSPKSDSE